MTDPVVHFAALLFIVMVVSAALAPFMEILIPVFLWVGGAVLVVAAGVVIFTFPGQAFLCILGLILVCLRTHEFWQWLDDRGIFKAKGGPTLTPLQVWRKIKLKRASRPQPISRLTSQHARNL